MIRLILVATMGLAAGAAAVAVAQDATGAGRQVARRMADGSEWTTKNLDVDAGQSYCYDDTQSNCRRYGRLYTWEAARQGCQSLGGGWRLPTEEDWRRLATHYGGASDQSDDRGRSAYQALLAGGSSGFNALLGGGRVSDSAGYARVDAHGLYWTATETDADKAWFYNFGKGGLALHRQREGSKQMALSVRCVRE